MWHFFRRKPLLSEEDEHFQIECYKWLLRHFGGDDFYKETQLILPEKEFFPAQANSPQEAAQVTFEQVKKYAGMEEWACRLEPQEKDPDLHIAPTVILTGVERSPLGTFSVNDKDEVTITYNPDIVSDSTQMVATFAHELSHYLTATAAEPPPGGWDNWEFATDIGAVFLGFGLFTANAAFCFQQHTEVGIQGWRSSRNGYLSEAEYSYSLAIFLRLKAIAPDSVFPHCNLNIRNHLKTALKELENNHVIQSLHDVRYAPKSSQGT